MQGAKENRDGDKGHGRTCQYCKQDKPWINTGKKLRDGSKIYVDEHGARWAGRRCPSCERSRVYAAVRCDGFEKDIILKQLEQSGYEVVSSTLPLKVRKDGVEQPVTVKRARAEQGKIVLEGPIEGGEGVIALVFESVRVCTREQAAKLGLLPVTSATEKAG